MDIVLVSFCPVFLKLIQTVDTWEKGGSSIRLACVHVCGVFSWLMVDPGGLIPLWVVLSLGRWAKAV